MKKVFGFLVISMMALGSQAQSISDQLAYDHSGWSVSKNELGIEIFPSVVSDLLNISVDEKLANGSVTVSIFNSIGEIVMEQALGLGLNKLDMTGLPNGTYVAVVRQNDIYTGKSNFEVI